MKEKRFPHPGNPLHQLGDQLGRRGDSEAQQRVSSWLEQAEQIETSINSWQPHCIPQPEGRICWCAQWLGGETQTSADSPGYRTKVDYMETA